jgi:ADP-heptose:LPS heptosyltransferase
MTVPEWSGTRLPRGRVLLLGDQGFGDVIQYSRFVREVAARVHEVVVICDPALAPLLSRLPGAVKVVSRWADGPLVTGWSRMLRLPLLLGIEVDTILDAGGYLTADPVRVQVWRERLAAASGRRLIGLAWAGNPSHCNDHRRSMPLAALMRLFRQSEIDFVVLQKAIPECDVALVLETSNLLDISADLSDFGETAAAVAVLDLVISIDSAVAHLAGALGRPVWTILPNPADWRWMDGRADTPWYASMRLFRQQTLGDWPSVILEVAEALQRS